MVPNGASPPRPSQCPKAKLMDLKRREDLKDALVEKFKALRWPEIPGNRGMGTPPKFGFLWPGFKWWPPMSF